VLNSPFSVDEEMTSQKQATALGFQARHAAAKFKAEAFSSAGKGYEIK
jgi:hypothetical protein